MLVLLAFFFFSGWPKTLVLGEGDCDHVLTQCSTSKKQPNISPTACCPLVKFSPPCHSSVGRYRLIFWVYFFFSFNHCCLWDSLQLSFQMCSVGLENCTATCNLGTGQLGRWQPPFPYTHSISIFSSLQDHGLLIHLFFVITEDMVEILCPLMWQHCC